MSYNNTMLSINRKIMIDKLSLTLDNPKLKTDLEKLEVLETTILNKANHPYTSKWISK